MNIYAENTSTYNSKQNSFSEAMKINVDRLYSGTLFTSINMKGFQISILNITDKEHWLCYLDEETEAFAWPGKRISHAIEKSTLLEYIEADNSVTVVFSFLSYFV